MSNVKLHELSFKGAPEPREIIYPQGVVGIGGAHSTYRISIGEGREDAHHTIIHFEQAKPDHRFFGVTNENLLAIVIHRLECFQQGTCPCPENDEAIEHLMKGMAALKSRSQRRIQSGLVGKQDEVPYTPVQPAPVEVGTVPGDSEAPATETTETDDTKPDGPGEDEKATEAAPEPTKEPEPEVPASAPATPPANPVTQTPGAHPKKRK